MIIERHLGPLLSQVIVFLACVVLFDKLMDILQNIFQVSAFSSWEKELSKIVFDSRYLLLTSRERKQVFEK